MSDDTRQPRAKREVRNRVTPPFNMTGTIAPGEDEQRIVELLGDKTECLELPLYNRYDVPSLLEGYNPAMEKLDAWACEKNAKDDEQDKRLDAVESKNEEQDGRLDKIEEKDREQDGRLDSIEAEQKTQNNRLDAIETEQTEQNGRLDKIEEKDKEQDGLLEGLRTDVDKNTEKNAQQDDQISSIKEKDSEQDGRLEEIDSEQATQDESIEDLKNRVQTIEENPYELPVSTEAVLGGVKMMGTHSGETAPLGAYDYTTGEYDSYDEMFHVQEGAALGHVERAGGTDNKSRGEYVFNVASENTFGVVKLDGDTIYDNNGVISANVSGGIEVRHVAQPFSGIGGADGYLELSNVRTQQGFDFIGNANGTKSWQGYTTFRLSFTVNGDVTDDQKIGLIFPTNIIISGSGYNIYLEPSKYGNAGTAMVKRYVSNTSRFYYNSFPCHFTKEGSAVVVNFDIGDNVISGETVDIATGDVVFVDFKIWSQLRYINK